MTPFFGAKQLTWHLASTCRHWLGPRSQHTARPAGYSMLAALNYRNNRSSKIRHTKQTSYPESPFFSLWAPKKLYKAEPCPPKTWTSFYSFVIYSEYLYQSSASKFFYSSRYFLLPPKLYFFFKPYSINNHVSSSLRLPRQLSSRSSSPTRQEGPKDQANQANW